MVINGNFFNTSMTQPTGRSGSEMMASNNQREYSAAASKSHLRVFILALLKRLAVFSLIPISFVTRKCLNAKGVARGLGSFQLGVGMPTHAARHPEQATAPCRNEVIVKSPTGQHTHSAQVCSVTRFEHGVSTVALSLEP